MCFATTNLLPKDCLERIYVSGQILNRIHPMSRSETTWPFDYYCLSSFSSFLCKTTRVHVAIGSLCRFSATTGSFPIYLQLFRKAALYPNVVLRRLAGPDNTSSLPAMDVTIDTILSLFRILHNNFLKRNRSVRRWSRLVTV